MSFRIQDPLFLLSAQTGLSASELQPKAASGNPDPEKAQEALKTGEPIPIVFCRRRNSNGGVMMQPKITEANFSNQVAEEELSTNGSTSIKIPYEKTQVKYLFVISEGDLPQMQIRDIFHGTCRRGTFNQAYNARAGAWDPGNDIYEFFTFTATLDTNNNWYSFNTSSLTAGQSVNFPGGPNYYYRGTDNILTRFERKNYGFPVFCGTSGTYSGLTTLSFEHDFNGVTQFDEIKKAVSVFIRKGLQVTRLADGVTGESDNFVDLAKYLFQANNRLPDDLIDNTSLTTAAKFTDANGFLFNGKMTESQNLLDWLQATSVNFLVRVSSSGGKFGMLPRLPYNTDHTIKTTQITPEFVFTEEHVVEGGFEISYISLEDREPVCFVVMWRQQPEADFGLVRTVQVRYANEAANGPFVNIDMSNYCTNENHAVKVGAFRLAQRKFITHHLRLTVRERSYNSSLVIGDLVRVRLRRETDEGDVEYHDKVYEINRIEKSFSSVIVYDLTHFPIDTQGRSIIAREVDAAVGAGNTIEVGRGSFNCDINSSSATTEVGSTTGGGGDDQPPEVDTEIDIDQPLPDIDIDTPFPDGPDNPLDPLDEELDQDDSVVQISGSSTGYANSSATPGNNVEVPSGDMPCGDGRVCFYRLDKATGIKTLRNCVTQPVNGKYFSSITTADIGYVLIAEGQCPDPSSDDGYGPVFPLGETAVIVPDVTAFSYARFVGTRTTYQNQDGTITSTPNTFSMVSTWRTLDPNATDPYLSVGSAWSAIGGLIYDWRILDVYYPDSTTTQYGTTLSWTPWVNYYNNVTQQYVGQSNTDGVPWRANVTASGSRFVFSGGAGLFIGGVNARGYQGAGLVVPVYSYEQYQAAHLPANTSANAPERTVSIQGVWQFSNDTGQAKTVDAEWKGVGDNGTPLP